MFLWVDMMLMHYFFLEYLCFITWPAQNRPATLGLRISINGLIIMEIENKSILRKNNLSFFHFPTTPELPDYQKEKRQMKAQKEAQKDLSPSGQPNHSPKSLGSVYGRLVSSSLSLSSIVWILRCTLTRLIIGIFPIF